MWDGFMDELRLMHIGDPIGGAAHRPRPPVGSQ